MTITEMDAASIYNLIQESIQGQLPIEALVQKLNEISESEATDKNVLLDLVADALVQCDVETSLCDNELRAIFLDVVKSLLLTGHLAATVAYERFELDTSAQIGLIPDKKQSNVLYNRSRTKLYFKQRKYNLLREENEGFAKVIVELSRLNQQNSKDVLANVTEIIGAYSIDPNRVLDLILEVFEFNSRGANVHEYFVEFLRSFYDDPAKITQLIILKLTFQIGPKESVRDDGVEFEVVSQSFYRLLAILIHKDILDLDEIYPYLLPNDGKILKHHENLLEEAKRHAGKYNRVIVGEEKSVKPVIKALKEDSPYDYHCLEVDNHKINICNHLIDLGDWDKASDIANKLPEFYCYSHPRVIGTLCGYLNYLIDPLYRECALPKSLINRIRPTRRHVTKEVKQIETITEFQDRIYPILKAIGPFLHHDTMLLTKVIRIFKHILLSKPNNCDQSVLSSEGPEYNQLIDMLNYSILPATTLSGSNCCLSRELWLLIKNFKYPIRYKLYHEWQDAGTNPLVLRNKGNVLLRAKNVMKRISKETLRQSGRNIGKLCYSNPVMPLNYVLLHVQSYENLITLVVDALRFLPPIALDALLYCTLEALLVDKDKKSADGMALAMWLTNLSNFSANFILRYKVEFISFVDYIANQLKIGNSLELVLLTDLIEKMTGIETIQAITDEQIEAMMGGDVLRTEAAYFNQVKNTRKPSARLKEALIESRHAMPLCILMAQIRDSLFFSKQDKTPLKLIGIIYDQCQKTLVQYGAFLSMNLSIDDYVNFLPPLEKLMTTHKLDPDSAFFLARPMIFHKIRLKFNELKSAALKTLQVEEGETPELSPQVLSIKFVEAARSVIDPIAESVQPLLAEKYNTSSLNAKLFVIFWTFSMSDIEVPLASYEREIGKLKGIVNDSSKSDDDPKRRKEKDRLSSLINKLKQEQADQLEHTKYIRLFLESEKNNLFCENSTYDNVYLESRRFVQHCPFARCILTAYDAIYSARFMLYLHELRVENYPTIICLDRLLCDLTYMMGACTENEASHYGRFLCHILKTTSHWHSSSDIYNQQCERFPGSIINIDNSEYISYETYRDICYKWHYRLTRSFSVALESNNYIQIRNALVVMISVIDYYPAIKHFGKGIGIKIEEVRNQEKGNRQDLFALATAYAGRLDDRKPHLIPESNFHTVDGKSSQRERQPSSSSRKKARHS